MIDILKWWPVLTVAGGGLIIAVLLYAANMQHSRNISKLWDEKISKESFDALKIKVEGMDKWTHGHEEWANVKLLESIERFTRIEKAIEISENNHQTLVALVSKVEAAFQKMQDKFDAFANRFEKAIDKLKED